MPTEQAKGASKVGIEIVEAFNAGDWKRFANALHPEVIYHETGTQRQTDNLDEYVRLSQGWKHAFPDARGTVRTALATGDTAAIEVLWEGTHQGPLETPTGTVQPSRRPIAVEGTLWITASRGKATQIRHQFDLVSLLQQIGAFPTPAHATT